MPEGGKTVLIICDYQLGIGDLPFAKAAVSHAAAALETGRKAGMLIVFTKVAFQPGYTDISPDNQAFATYKAKDLLPPPASRLIPTFQPRPNEILLNKDRFNAFIGNDLRIILRAQDVKRLVIAGVATSGVVVSTFCAAADEDFELIILSDACADPNPRLNDELMTNLFPRSARVLSVSAWAASLTA